MKKLTLFLVAMTMSLLSFAQTQMSGTYTVGTGGSYDYSSMADAGMAIKEAEFTGDVTLLICTDLTETINTGIVNKSEYTLTIRPDKDENRTITYTTATDNTGPTGVFVIGGDMTKTPGSTIGWASVPTKNVIVDGAAEGKTTPRLKITNEKWGTNVILYGDVQDVVIRNCILVGRSSSTAYALVFRSENYSKTSKDIAPKNCLVENCILQSSSTSSQTVYFQGNQAHSEAGWPASITIRNSTIKAHTRGIYVRQVCNLNVEGCTFDMSNSSGGILAHAIMGEGARGTINVKGNKFIKNSTANYHGGTYGLQTITASGGADVWVIENNYFAGYDALKAISNTTNGTEARLVAVRCGDYCEVRHNTFHMPNLTKDQASKLVSASPTTLLWLAGSHQYPVQNNIFVCEETTANVSLIRGGLNENVTGNVFYHKGGNAAIVAAAPSCMTFADLETSYPTQAATSKWTNVTFTDAANGDLSLAGSSDGDLNLAVDRLAEVLTDINGTARREKTYAGAYEGSEFPAEVCSVTTTVVPVDGGIVEGGGDYAKGASVTLTATSNDHYEFTGWTGDVESPDNPLTITVDGNKNITANFQEHDKYTITAVANDENMGTVTGGDTYYAGESATLKATAKSGYVFAGWADGEKNATRTVTVSGDATYTANFQAIAPRAWAYDLKVAENGDNYKFTFNATAAGSATLLFADIDGNELVAPHAVGTVAAGANTVTLAKTTFEGVTKDVYWSVKMDGEAIPAISEITDASKGIYNFYLPQGVAVDNNPESSTFSKIYIAESTDGASDGGSDRADNQKRGIFIYDQTLAELNPTSNVGVIPSNVTLANTTRNALKRIAINPNTNEVAFAYNASPAAVWAVSTENVAGEATNLLAGLGFDYCNSLCFDENGTLYIFDNGAGYPAKGSLYKIANGEKITIFSENGKYGNADNSLASDGRGGLWIAQNRSKLDGFNQLAHVSASGVIDFEVNSTTTHGFASLETSRGAMAYNPRENILAIGCGASGTIGVSLYQVTYDPSNGVPSLEYIGATPSLGKNVEGIAFDYAGDLYALSANTERFYKFTLPTNENTCTVPAPSSQKLVLGTQCEVTVTINDPAMGSVEGAGQHEKGAEVTLTAKPVAHHRFVNWTGDKTSTDNPFKFTIEGNVALTANFEATPQWTITVTANDDSMGTVSGGGTYDEGAEVTITATPNATYRFVKWSDDVTDATRTFSAAENLTLQAIFEKVPNRAWAYDLSQVADGDNYKFSFVATTAGEATLLFADKDANELVAPYAVGTVAAGANTVTLAKTTFEGVTKDVYWSVKMDGEEITAVAEITDQSKGIYDFYSMRGVVVDNDPNSTDFGKIYVEMSLNGASNGGSERTKTQTAGIFIYDQQLNELNTPSNVGYKPTMPSSYTELGTAAEAMKRLAINPTNGNLAFGNNISGEGSVWSVSRNNLTGAATNIIEGATGIDKVNAICYDENGSLYVLANVTTGYSKFNLYKFTDGVQTELTLGGEKIFVDAEVAMASDGRGGIWIAQNRSGISQYKILSHVNVAEDKLDFVVETEKDYSDWFGGNCFRAAVAYNPIDNVLAVQGINRVSLFSVSYDASGVPSITKLVQTPTVGKNIDGLAFDYAGDLYVVNSSAEKLFKFTIPTTDNICTVPAPASQKLVLGTQCEVTVNVNDPAMGSVEGAGQHEKDATVTLKATANEHYQFVNWTKGAEVLSAENPYSFIVTEDVTITANFAELPKYTITVNVNDNTMGSVTGGGTVYVGESVTLTATPNSGYAFVKWDDGITEATRTVEVVGDKTYTAIFQAMNPRAWAYDLRMVEDGDNYKFTFKATSAGDATLLFTNKAGTPVAPTSYAVGSVEAGEKSVTIAQSEFGGTEDIYWSVQMDGAAIENMIEITDASKGIYDIVAPQGIAVDNNTDSKHFGQVYVAAATDGTVSRGAQTRGIFVYDPILNELNSPNTGYLPANATLTNTTRQAIHRVAVNPTNNQVAFAYNISVSSAIWSMNPENLAGDAVDLIEGAGITKANSLCFDESGALYVMDNANTSTGGNIYKIKDGEANVFAVAQTGYYWGVEENAMTPDGRGGLWIAQNRWQVDGYPVLSHVDKDGLVDFAVTSSSSEALKALFPHDDNNASYRGQCAYYVADDILAFGGNKEAVLFKVTYDTNNVPTNLEKLMSTGKLGTNIDGLAFDYAGDLYVASENTKRFYKFVVPTNNNTCTVPAPASQVIKKEQRYTVTVSVNDDAMGTATGGGEYKAGETIMLTATANAGYRFVNWTYNNTTSTDNPLSLTVEGDISVTANFEEKPLEMVGVVKRAVQIGESTIVLTHEADGTPHLYKVVDGELEAEISQEGVEAAAAGYLSISDIAATEDGKLVACNYVHCKYDDAGNTSYFYIWNNLVGNPSVWFTSKKSTNYSNASMGYTMAVKGTSTDAVVTITGFNQNSGTNDVRFSHHTISGGVYTESATTYKYLKGIANTTNYATVGTTYELNASPFAAANWIIDGENITPTELDNSAVSAEEVTINASLDETHLGKKFNGATYLTVEDKHLMVAPYADANGKVAGVKVIDITNGLAAAQVLETLNLDDPAEATAAATAVLQDEYGLIITLVTDATLHRLEYTTAEVYTRSVTNGDFGTICLPYGSSNMTGAVFYEVAGQEPGKVYLDQVTTLEAGKPYIFRATASTITVVYEGDEALSAGNHNGLYGTFTDNTTVEQGNYIVYNNELRLCGTGCYINAYRAYLNLTAVTSDVPAPMPGRQRIGMNVQGGNETTALDNITEGNGTITPTMEGTYDVLGRKLTQPTTTGVYIINGKKVFVVK